MLEKLLSESGGGVAGKYQSVLGDCGMDKYIRSPAPLQTCSPSCEISISLAHIEHFIVGKKLDGLAVSAILSNYRHSDYSFIQIRVIMKTYAAAVWR